MACVLSAVRVPTAGSVQVVPSSLATMKVVGVRPGIDVGGDEREGRVVRVEDDAGVGHRPEAIDVRAGASPELAMSGWSPEVVLAVSSPAVVTVPKMTLTGV